MPQETEQKKIGDVVTDGTFLGDRRPITVIDPGSKVQYRMGWGDSYRVAVWLNGRDVASVIGDRNALDQTAEQKRLRRIARDLLAAGELVRGGVYWCWQPNRVSVML